MMIARNQGLVGKEQALIMRALDESQKPETEFAETNP